MENACYWNLFSGYIKKGNFWESDMLKQFCFTKYYNYLH